jgi:hypothetical protein
VDGETMMGFGFKQAWLAIRDGEVDAVLRALRLRDLGPVSWRAGVDLAYLTDDRVVLTPPLPGAGGSSWLLVAGRWLFGRGADVDVAALSATLGTEVQLFSTHRVPEAHRWERAVDGQVVRAFSYVGESGELVTWQGEPDAAESAIGITRPGGAAARDDENDENDENDGDDGDDAGVMLVSEGDVMRMAAAWSLDPSALDGRPSPGPLRAAAAP